MSEGVACCHWNMSQVLQVLDEYFEGGLQRDQMKAMMVCRVVVSVVVPRKMGCAVPTMECGGPVRDERANTLQR